MTAAAGETDDLGWTTVSSSGKSLAVDLPVDVLAHLGLNDGDRVFYLVEDERTVLAYHEDDVPDESQRLLGIQTVTEQSTGEPSVSVPSTALTILGSSEGDHVRADYGLGASARLHHAPGRADSGFDEQPSEDDSPDNYKKSSYYTARVPEEIDWTDYAAYHCRFPRCNEPCLNRVDSLCSLTQTCRACYDEVKHGNRSIDFDDLDVRGEHLPEWAHDLDLSDQTTASEVEGEPARPAAQPERSWSRQPPQRSEEAAPTASASGEQPEPDRERSERSAPARSAGSAPLRGDPEDRAHPPNPCGEGAPNGDAHHTESEETTKWGSL